MQNLIAKKLITSTMLEMSTERKIGRNDPCPCGAMKIDKTPLKYKKCCGLKIPTSVPKQVIDYFMQNQPVPEPFEKGGFLTGRPFITEVFNDNRMRAVANVVYRRPMDETFHMFLFRRFSEILTQKWVEEQEILENPHEIIKWFRETQAMVLPPENSPAGTVRAIQMTGNIRALLSLAYDFYSLQHCSAPVQPKLLNRLRDSFQFQGARYEIAVAALACRAGFEIKWINTDSKHCEFTGVHRITGDKAAFEVKSHHREGVLGQKGIFEADNARIKIIDHVREAVEQVPTEDIPLIIFDDLNLPLTAEKLVSEKKWFMEVEKQLEKYGFLNTDDYKRCGALFITNFSWHFHSDIPPDENELLAHFHLGGKYSLKPETVLNFLELASKQYGYVPMLQHEFPNAPVPQFVK
jgi:hypothetical protein